MTTLKDELKDELTATLAARRELSPDHEAQLAEQFLERLDRQIDARIKARTKKRKEVNPTEILAVALVFAIPLSGIAVAGAGFIGLLVVWVAIAGVVYYLTHD